MAARRARAAFLSAETRLSRWRQTVAFGLKVTYLVDRAATSQAWGERGRKGFQVREGGSVAELAWRRRPRELTSPVQQFW